MNNEVKTKQPAREIAYRVFFYLAGLLVLAFGVRFAINAELGISPVSSAPRALYLSLVGFGIETFSYGMCVIFFNFVCMVVQIAVLRRDFKMINFFQMLVSFCYGFFVDFAGLIVGDFTIPTYAGRLLMLAISILLIAFGIQMYMSAKFTTMATEGMGLAITAKLKKYPYHKVKVVIDCAFVAIAILIMLVCGHNPFTLVREGTIITALTVGAVMGFIRRFTDPVINRLCFGQAPAAKPAAD